jgi:dihydropteroate synthase
MREVIAKRIIEIAQQGVKDQQILVDDAVRFLAANYSDVRKQPA